MKDTKSRKFRGRKTEYMSEEAFANGQEALEGALASERGERDLHVTRIRAQSPPKAVSPKDRQIGA